MGDCCDPRENYRTVFSDRFAKRVARRYRKRGLNRTQQRLVGFLSDRGLEGASVLEIGGGVGDLHVELLRRGASRVTNLEISDGYEDQAAELLAATGLEGRVDRRLLDIAVSPDEVEPADIVVLHRVVCCYPDYERLLGAAGSHAQRMLVFSHPPRNLVTRALIGWENLLRRIRRNDFRAFVHPPGRMVAALRRTGLTPSFRHHGLAWDVVGLQR